ncbi:MAG TPA: exonuclease domain-containing protein, partial [Bacteroidales bacterium]|nr:exonuclease domain-containing protein [Bacteroidales bacterium]
DIHGITPDDTANAPTFDKVWHKIEPFIKEQNVVAHNGFSFDFQVLEKTLEYYGMQAPDYEKYCTYRIFKDNLASLCKYYKIPLNHHDALSDAKACAELFLLHLNNITS